MSHVTLPGKFALKEYILNMKLYRGVLELGRIQKLWRVDG